MYEFRVFGIERIIIIIIGIESIFVILFFKSKKITFKTSKSGFYLTQKLFLFLKYSNFRNLES